MRSHSSICPTIGGRLRRGRPNEVDESIEEPGHLNRGPGTGRLRFKPPALAKCDLIWNRALGAEAPDASAGVRTSCPPKRQHQHRADGSRQRSDLLEEDEDGWTEGVGHGRICPTEHVRLVLPCWKQDEVLGFGS